MARSLTQIGHLYVAYGYSNQAYRVFVAQGLHKETTDLDDEEQGLISREFSTDAVQAMVLGGEMMDATSVAAFGLAKLKGFLN